MNAAEAAGAGDFPSARSAGFALAVVAALAFLMSIDQGVTGLLLEPMKHEMGLTDVQVGFAHSTSMGLAYALLSVPMGLLADRVSRARLLVAAASIWIVSMVLAGVSHSIAILVVSRIGLGTANAIIFPAGMSLLADSFRPHRRAAATSTYGGSRVAGHAVALLGGGLIYGTFDHWVKVDPRALFGLTPWRALFVLFGALAGVVLAATLILREPQRKEIVNPDGGGFGELWTYRRLLLPLFLGLFFMGSASAAQQTWTAPVLIRIYRQQPADFAVWMGASQMAGGFVGVVAAAAFANLAQRFGERRMLLPAIVATLACVPASFYSVVPNMAAFGLLFAVLQTANFTATTVVVITINLRIPNELRGLVLGMQTVFASLSAALSPGLVALVGRGLGGDMLLGQAMLLVAAPSWLAAALCYGLASRSSRNA